MGTKWAKRLAYALTGWCLVVLMTACGQKDPPAAAVGFEGTYAIEQRGNVTPKIEITKNKDGDGYVWQELHADKKIVSESLPTKPLPKDEFEKMIKTTLPGSYEGIQVQRAALVKLDPNASLGRVTSGSGYFLVTMLGVIPVTKVS
ncbi:hypothetical protein WK76_24940 [Burkholderia ubonensis]|uniref:hypothetical protein n=1 Tax=Burkholderia ubonensis TaxID=101571 RepID=UPI0007584529|nr:hypothetical protein [Burkholderia ubonensis]KVU84276.1 hypothetical protein WK76_24940 [Burkholderia ubonensis]